MQKHNSTFLILIAVGFVLVFPFAYGAVEPSIIINMIGGQTEKPIQIKNSGGTEVFSVDVDGTLFPAIEGVSQNLVDRDSGIISIYFEQEAEISTFPVGSADTDDYEDLAVWRIDFSSSASVGSLPTVHVMREATSGFMKDDGTGNGEMWFYESENNVNWFELHHIASGSSTSYEGASTTDVNDVQLCTGRTSPTDPCYIGIRWGSFNTGGGEEIFVKEIKAYLEIYVPLLATVTRVI